MRSDVSPEVVNEILVEAYGLPRRNPPPLNNKADPLDELIYILITLMTNENNANRAYERLKSRFPTWREAAVASVDELVAVLRSAGLANQKAPRIKEMLRTIQEIDDEVTLDFLRGRSTRDVEDFLVGLQGIGRKSARCVMVYSLAREVLPVDSHVYRISRRLGLIDPTVAYDRAMGVIQESVDPELRYDMHVNMVKHGREVCVARSPECSACALGRVCKSYEGGHFVGPPPAPGGRRPRH